MKHCTVFIALLIAFQVKCLAQAFTIPVGGGNNDATEISCDYYQLTPNVTFQQGAIWYSHQLNLANSFDYNFQIYLGNNNGAGADGMAFVIQNQSQTLGPAGTFGSQLGYGTFPGKSLGVEFDTHGNGAGAPYGDIPQHHIAIDTGGIQFPPAAGPVTALASGGNIDDGNWHTCEIVWTPGTETMAVYFDGSQRLTCTFSAGLVASVFGGQNLLYWGWTGASGSKFNVQRIRVPLVADFVSGINYAHCGLNNVAFTDSSVSGLNSITYSWNLGDGNTSTQQDVTHSYANSGVYNVALTVTDGGGCIADTTIPVAVNSVPVITPSQTNVTCNGLGNGVARGIVTSGTPLYTYNWFPAVSTIDSAQGLPPGNYALIVVDHNMCADTTAFIITQPPVLTDAVTHTNVLCYGDSSGSVNATAGGGTPTYIYSWNPNIGTGDNVSGLAAGSYTSIVTDANGCTVSAQAVINQPQQPLTTVLSDSNLRCNGVPTGYIILTTSGGTQAYNYTWNPPSAGSSASGITLAAGNYQVTITDANGCSLTRSATLTQPLFPLTASATALPELCSGQSTGTIVVIPSGGTAGYTFSLSNGGAPITSSTDTINNLSSGTYTVSVTDHNGCTFDTAATINAPPPLLVTFIDSVSPKCYHYYDGSLVALASGGSPGPGYNYAFSNGVTDTTGINNNLSAGNYVVTVTDKSGCTDSTSIILAQPDSVITDVTPTPIQVNLGDQLQLYGVTNQNGTITYNWTPTEGLSCYDCADPVFNGVYSQPYTLTTTNQDSCFGSVSFIVTVVPNYNIFFPNAFTPGQGGANAAWQIFGEKHAIKLIELSVFDRIGEKVFESNSVDFMWDGSFKSKEAQVGVYTYEARVVWLNNYTEKLFTGSVTLLR
jgi:gliding motility-associated-like protein